MSRNYRKLRRVIVRGVLHGVMWFSRYMPFCLVWVFAKIFDAIGYGFASTNRKIAKESITTALGSEKSKKELDRIVRRCFFRIVYSVVELIYYLSHPRKCVDTVTFEGKEKLDNVLSKGKGAVVVTAHFGNFSLMALRLVQEGYSVSSIFRPLRDPKLSEDVCRIKHNLGIQAIYSNPSRRCVLESLKVLKNKHIVSLLIDQDFADDKAVFVNFFGKKAATAIGAYVFAMRSGGPIVPMFMVKEPRGNKHRVVIEDPIYVSKGQSSEEVLSKVMLIIEQYIRQYPHEWAWMNKRWKTRPSSECLKGD